MKTIIPDYPDKEEMFVLVSDLREAVEGMRKEIPTYLNKRGHHTNSAHRKIKYNQALDEILTLLDTLEGK